MGKGQKEKKKIDTDFVFCPCCGKQREVQKQRRLLAIQEAFSNNWICQGDWAVRYAKARSIRWACDSCLKEGAAIEGRPWEQLFCDYKPYLAYFDRSSVCEDCHEPFVFSAREQQYWYETLKFWVQSFPKQCLACRRKRRARQKALQNLQKELPQLDPTDPQQLLHIASLYLIADCPEKAGEYVARARKRARNRGEFEALAEQIETVQRQIQEITTSNTF